MIIYLLSGLSFLFIAIVGGGFSLKEITIPKVPKRMRVISFFVGLGLIYMSLGIFIPPNGPILPNGIIYSDNQVDTSIHNIEFSGLVAKSVNPPKINDRITIEFELKNTGDNPIKFNETFIAARNPILEKNKDFGHSNQGKTLQPQKTITIKKSIVVDQKGTWEFWPCYALDIPEIRDENNLCPHEWHSFEVVVE